MPSQQKSPEKLELIISPFAGIALNVTAKEFVPSSVRKYCSTELCPSDEKYQVSNSLCDNKRSEKSSSKFANFNNPSKQNSPVTERKCVRCKKTFQTYVGGGYLEQEECRYHWGKVRSGQQRGQHQLTCCGAEGRERRPGGGCTSAPAHVWSGLPGNTNIVGPLEGYVKTKHRKTYPTNGNFGVVGLDCEMCYTSQGLELVKVVSSSLLNRLELIL